MTKSFILNSLFIGALLTSSCGSKQTEQVIEEPVVDTREVPQEASVSENTNPVPTDTITTASGLKYIMLEEGSGPKPNAGQTVLVNYAGFLTDGTKFDSSFDRGEPIEFALGKGIVIKGWDEGIALLNTGSKARFIIPQELAYGEGGYGKIIPPLATLIFDVQLVGIK